MFSPESNSFVIDFLSSAINELMTAISNQPSTPLTHAMALYACISFLRDAPTDISLANNIYMHDLRHALEHVNKYDCLPPMINNGYLVSVCFLFYRKLAAKENKENKAQVAAAREALTLVLEEEKNHDGYVVRLSTLFAAAHQLSLDHVDVDLNLLSLPMFSIAKNLEPQAAVRKITGIVDVLCSELKKNGYPVDSRLENDLKSFSTHVREQVSRQKNSPLTCTQLVHIFWPLVRCIFRTLNDCDQSVFSLPIVSQLVSSFLTNLANAPMHAVVF